MPPFFDPNGDPQMDPYTTLSLPPTASEAEIKKAYRMQMLQLHPDKLAPTMSEDSVAAVTEKFHNVKDAYEFLISPLHLTSRRLYMAKMASRRAEYERREAFLRRNGGAAAAAAGSGPSSVPTEGVGGYRSGGGGAAGMAGTGMPQHQRAQRRHTTQATSHAVPPRGKAPTRCRSNVNFNAENRENQRGRRGTERRNTSTGVPNGHHAARRRDRANGYKSDSARFDPTSKSRPGRTSQTNNARAQQRGGNHRDRRERNGQQKDSQHPRRGKSEQPRRKDGDRGRRAREARDERERRERERKEERRRRARSAPARCSRRGRTAGERGQRGYDKRGSGDGGGVSGSGSGSDLPREFFCPLTNKLMKDPVRDPDGNVYEREAIERWLRVQSSSPVTNGRLNLDMLRPDKELKRAIYKATGEFVSISAARLAGRSISSPTIRRCAEAAGVMAKLGSSQSDEDWAIVECLGCLFVGGDLVGGVGGDRAVCHANPASSAFFPVDVKWLRRSSRRMLGRTCRSGKPRSKSQTRTKRRSESPTNELVSGRVLIDSYLREISSKSKLSVSLDGMGICAFSYRRTTFVIEVPITPNAGFMVYSSFDGEYNTRGLSEKMDAWNKWLGKIGRASRVSHVRAGRKTVFTLRGSEKDMSRCDVFQKTLEYFVEMSLKLHNLLHPTETKTVENVCLTRSPVAVA
ncbi:hypothetical protein ACHAWF_013123 [Thalassiosira exigua]